jgi:alpha-mannosidase
MPVTVHMIGQAHLDPVWLWRWTEGRAEALATSQSALDRLEEYPAFTFTRGEAQVYQWIEQESPAMFQAIREQIAQGRWHVVNGMIIQPDMNLPQGESIVRQALLGKSYFQQKFGLDVRVAYCVDTFGHAGTLPQILKGCGFDHYVFMRPQEHEKNLPPQAFWWQGLDGSRLLTFRISRSYASWGGDESELRLIEAALADRPEKLNDVVCFFGVGNHGGGPTRAQIEGLIALDSQREDIHIRFSSLPAYFAAIQPQVDSLPLVADELQFHAVGCYSVNSRLKRLHRQAECALLQAERMAALAEIWAGQIPDRTHLRRLWQTLCFNQFHDILAGTCIKEAQDDAEMALAGTVVAAKEMINDAGRLIGARVDSRGQGGSVLLFNPFPYPWHGWVEYEPWTGWQDWRSNAWGLVDDSAQPVAHQLIEAQPATGEFARLLFRAELPPMGYRLYRFSQGVTVSEPSAGVSVQANGLENEFLHLVVNPHTGNIISCIDKATGAELVGPAGWNVPQVLEDTSDTWSHAVRGFEGVLGQFAQARIKVVDQGPLQASLFIERNWEDASGAHGTWLQQMILRAGEKEIMLHNSLHWHGAWRTLKLAFDAAVQAPAGLRDVPFGALPFPNDNAETPMQMWVAVTGQTPAASAGLAVLNDGKYGCDLSGTLLRLTILRSPPYAYHVPHKIGAKQRYDWIDQGLQEFSLVLRPFIGSWQEAGIVHRAREMNLPVVPITLHAHSGELPARVALCHLDSRDLELTTLKPAEDGSGYILRIADCHGLGGSGTLAWQGQAFSVVCPPFGVLTYRIAQEKGAWILYPCDMLEKPLK